MSKSPQAKDTDGRFMCPARLSYASDQERFVLVLTEVPDHSLTAVSDVVGTQITEVPVLAIRGIAIGEAENMAARLHALGAVVEIWEETASISPSSVKLTKQERISIPQPPNTFIILLNPGEHKIQVIKEVRSVTSLGLKEAKDLVDHPPSIIGPLQAQDAVTVSARFKEAGAECEVTVSSALEDLKTVDVILTKYPSLAADAWPDSLLRLLHSYTSDELPDEPVVIATGIIAYLAERIARIIDEAGGKAIIEPM